MKDSGHWGFDLDTILSVEAIDEFSGGTFGGRLKQWLLGAIIPALLIALANHSLFHGTTDLFAILELLLEEVSGAPAMQGKAAITLAVATAWLGGFLHYHFFWGISSKLWKYNYLPKLISLWICIPCLGYSLYKSFF